MGDIGERIRYGEYLEKIMTADAPQAVRQHEGNRFVRFLCSSPITG